MKEVKIGKHDIVMYDSIEELPMRRFHWFNKMLLIDSGIGSDLSAFDQHLVKARSFILAKKHEQALTELDNLRQNYYFVMEGISPKFMAFSALVVKIDGEEYNELSDDALKKVIEKISDAPMTALNQTFEEVKKKIDEDLHLYFPQVFDDAVVKEYYDLLKKRTIAELDKIIKGDEDDEIQQRLEQITLKLITFINPSAFSGSESLEIQYERNFDKMCHVIAHYLNTNPKNYTVTEFYTAYEYVLDLIKNEAKSKQIKFK